MNEKHQKRISKFLSLVLRHQPEKVGLELEQGGWVDVADLIEACEKNGLNLTLDELKTVVENNDKKRFSFDESGTKIRASQGHSVEIEIEFEQKEPPDVLYHRTAEKNVVAILKDGLSKMSRHHVHLSVDVETAQKVGKRYGKPVIFEVDTNAMRENGFEFYVSANGVWLVDSVPPQFLQIFK